MFTLLTNKELANRVLDIASRDSFIDDQTFKEVSKRINKFLSGVSSDVSDSEIYWIYSKLINYPDLSNEFCKRARFKLRG